MLPKLNILFLVLSVLLLMSCSPSKDVTTKSHFPFEYKNDAYEIISINAPTGEGINFLTKIDDDTTVFKTLDQNQDGVIDLIQYGSVSKEEANHIYSYGIQQAIAQNKFKTRNSDRTYVYSDSEIDYAIQTSGFYEDMLYNKFTIQKKSSTIEEIFVDWNADGELDQIKSGNRDLQDAQRLYESYLQKGIDKKRIEISGGKYVVKAKRMDPPS